MQKVLDKRWTYREAREACRKNSSTAPITKSDASSVFCIILALSIFCGIFLPMIFGVWIWGIINIPCSLFPLVLGIGIAEIMSECKTVGGKVGYSILGYIICIVTAVGGAPIFVVLGMLLSLGCG